MRIVSLLPSATEIVSILGLDDQLVGVTHECDFPPCVRDLPKVTRSLIPAGAASGEIDRIVREQLQTSGALYTLDVPTLQSLAPDLIVTQALCNVCAVAEDEVRAAAASLPKTPDIVTLEPQTLDEVFDSIYQVAEAAGATDRFEEVISGLEMRVERVASRTARLSTRPRVAVLEWLDPPFSSGHWNPELVRLAGGIESLGVEGTQSRTLTWDEVLAAQPDVVFIACCGFEVARTMQDVARLYDTPQWRELPAVRNGRVHVADGSQYFNRPGPRLVDSLEILAHALHPSVHPLPDGVLAALQVEPQGV